MRTNDIYFCSFPKSGVTYFSFMFAGARLKLNGLRLAPTMYNIDYLVVDTHKMGKLPTGQVWRDGLGDIYKSHNPYFDTPNVVYILREPVATLKSYYNFRKKQGVRDTLIEFLNGPEGVAGWMNHVRSWLIDNNHVSQSIFVIKYDQLMKDPGNELTRLGEQLGLSFSDEEIRTGIEASSLERMRYLEDRFSVRNPVYNKFDLEFVRKKDERTVDEFTPNIVEYINTVTFELRHAVEKRLENY